MLTLTEKLQKINAMRKQALSNPEFIRAAKAHEEAIKQQNQLKPEKIKKRKARQKSFADVYRETSFSMNPAGTQH